MCKVLVALSPMMTCSIQPLGMHRIVEQFGKHELVKLDTLAQVGQETFRLCRDLVNGIVLVENTAISAAIKDVFNETRSILEPAGAVAVAGAKAYLQRHNLKVIS